MSQQVQEIRFKRKLTTTKKKMSTAVTSKADVREGTGSADLAVLSKESPDAQRLDDVNHTPILIRNICGDAESNGTGSIRAHSFLFFFLVVLPLKQNATANYFGLPFQRHAGSVWKRTNAW